MEGSKKSKKSTLSKILKISAVIVSPIIYLSLIYLFSYLNFGTLWEEMLNLELTPNNVMDFLKDNLWSWISLIICRLIIYILPAIIFYFISLCIRDKRKSKLKIFAKCLNLQFLGYIIYQAIIILLGLDYLLGLDPFTNISIYMTLFGYVLTLSRDKNIDFGKIKDEEF